MTVDDSKVTATVWGPLDQYIVTGHESGALSQYDIIEVLAYVCMCHVLLWKDLSLWFLC